VSPTAAVILDRDGTLIDVVRDEETGVVTTAFAPSQLRLLDGALPGLVKLHEAGFVLAIATNQPGPAKGQISRDAVTRTNAALVELLGREGVPIAAVEVCMHHPTGGPGGDASLVGPCACRKPGAGMLEALATRLGFDRAASWMLGDSAADVTAGRTAQLQTALLLNTSRCELCPLRGEENVYSANIVGPTIADIAEQIVAQRLRR
jgi:D-glycero-D-manno-heptose 1,7-bisphosphate phosphatase